MALRVSALGLPDRTPADGATGDVSNRLPDLPRVRIGGAEAKVTDAALSSDSLAPAVGVWNLLVQVPAWSAPGDRVPVQVIAGGVVNSAVAQTAAAGPPARRPQRNTTSDAAQKNGRMPPRARASTRS